jgi:hypothetical protein
MSVTYAGTCVCGRVRYELDTEPKITVACHRSLCRKATGSAFATWTLVPTDHFRWTAGSEEIREFRSSDHGRRMFCGNCGTTLGNLTTHRAAFMHLAAGTLDRAPALRIKFHAYVGSKASWYEIADSYPRFEELPDSAK